MHGTKMNTHLASDFLGSATIRSALRSSIPQARKELWCLKARFGNDVEHFATWHDAD